ncbi:MAG: peptidoglycan recognition protein family protein [Armatimonadota bacterium]
MKRLRRSLRWILLLTVIAVLAVYGRSWWMHRHWLGRLPFHRFPSGIVIHHTATPPIIHGHRVDAATVEQMHIRRRFTPVAGRDGKVYHIGYHYVVLQDGTVQPGRPEYLRGQHTSGYPDMLGIVLVGNFERFSNLGVQGPLTPPPAQLAAAERLTRTLMRKYGLTCGQVYLHRDLTATACPGDCFPRGAFYRAIGQ